MRNKEQHEGKGCNNRNTRNPTVNLFAMGLHNLRLLHAHPCRCLHAAPQVFLKIVKGIEVGMLAIRLRSSEPTLRLIGNLPL